jgi:hypothetical protein
LVGRRRDSLTTCACPVESAEPAAKLHSTWASRGSDSK